jgi:DNA-binding LacI/PurR family transcriptional regulator/AraC-like DNA-binding protein
MNSVRKTIGIFLNDSGTAGNFFLEELQKGFIDYAGEKDVNLVFLIGGRIDSPYVHEKNRNSIYDFPLNERIDGIICLSHMLSAFIDRERMKEFILKRSGVPILSSGLEIEGIPSMVIDNRAGMADLINHLILSHGRRRIAMIRGPGSAVDAEERYFAYLAALNAHGIPVDPALIIQSDFSISGGSNAVKVLLDQRRVAFDALVAANDDLALGAIHELAARNIKVPETVAVTGFVDSLNSRQSSPAITTVHQPIYEFARHAMEIMLGRLTGSRLDTGCIHYPAILKIRESCGCRHGIEKGQSFVPDSGRDAENKTGYVSSIEMQDMIRSIGDNMQFSKDAGSLFQMITQWLPSLGITTCYIVLYESPGVSPLGGNLEYALSDGEVILPPGKKIPLAAPAILPGSIKSLSRVRHSLYLAPLFYGDFRIGHILFNHNSRQFIFYEAFRACLSQALMVVLYRETVRKVRFHQEALTNARIESLSGTVKDLQKTLKKMQDSIAGNVGGEDTEGLHDIRIQRAIAFIHDHYNDQISLEDVAGEAYISANYLSTVFKQMVGKGFSDYLTSIRINKSLALLKNPHLRIGEIARLIGYPNVQYFIQLFKKETGCTPSKYRETMRISDP